MTAQRKDARDFLAGKARTFEDTDTLWKDLKRADEISLARPVLERLRDGKRLVNRLPADRRKEKLCQQGALLTRNDAELGKTVRHERALEILAEELGNLADKTLDGDAETFGIAAGILKQRWSDLGQIEDLGTDFDAFTADRVTRAHGLWVPDGLLGLQARPRPAAGAQGRAPRRGMAVPGDAQGDILDRGDGGSPRRGPGRAAGRKQSADLAGTKPGPGRFRLVPPTVSGEENLDAHSRPR
jgi:hypothetical protein